MIAQNDEHLAHLCLVQNTFGENIFFSIPTAERGHVGSTLPSTAKHDCMFMRICLPISQVIASFLRSDEGCLKAPPNTLQQIIRQLKPSDSLLHSPPPTFYDTPTHAQ